MPVDPVLPHDLDDLYGPGAEDADIRAVSESESESEDNLFCPEHHIPLTLVDKEDESLYVCPECEREKGELLGWE